MLVAKGEKRLATHVHCRTPVWHHPIMTKEPPSKILGIVTNTYTHLCKHLPSHDPTIMLPVQLRRTS